MSAPTLTPSLPRMKSRYSGKVSQHHGTAASKVGFLMSSITWNIEISFAVPSGFTGARESEQLPITTVVTPCSSDGVARPSQQSCGSKWVWMSMKPGLTTRPAASMVRSGASTTGATLPSRTNTSRRTGAAPVPSTTNPFRIASVLMAFPIRLPVLQAYHRGGDS